MPLLLMLDSKERKFSKKLLPLLLLSRNRMLTNHDDPRFVKIKRLKKRQLLPPKPPTRTKLKQHLPQKSLRQLLSLSLPKSRREVQSVLSKIKI